MYGSALTMSLLLWLASDPIRGEVIAPARLSAVAGQPFTLSCNITLKTGDKVQQVRWLNQRKEVLLSYGPSKRVRIFPHQPEVELTIAENHASGITIKKAHPNDNGCYSCAFDVYPSGEQKGTTCLTVTVSVGQEGNKTAVSGKPVTLSCWHSLPEQVKQVLWKKTAEQGDTTTVAFYAKKGEPVVEEAFRGRMSLNPSMGDTQLSIQPVQTEDEGCYTCEFNSYPEGTRKATACLSVYVLPKPEVSYVTSSSGVVEANCTAKSRPVADIKWDVEGDNRTLGPPYVSYYEEGDGTTVVTSTLLFQSGLLNDRSIKCVVHHQGLEKPVSVALNTTMPTAIVILISVCGVAAVLLLCLCVCLCKCFICTDD